MDAMQWSDASNTCNWKFGGVWWGSKCNSAEENLACSNVMRSQNNPAKPTFSGVFPFGNLFLFLEQEGGDVAVLFWSSNVTPDQKTKQACLIKHSCLLCKPALRFGLDMCWQEVLLRAEKGRGMSLVKPVEKRTRLCWNGCRAVVLCQQWLGANTQQQLH